MSVKKKDRWRGTHFRMETETHIMLVSGRKGCWFWSVWPKKDPAGAKLGNEPTEKKAKLAARRWAEANK